MSSVTLPEANVGTRIEFTTLTGNAWNKQDSKKAIEWYLATDQQSVREAEEWLDYYTVEKDQNFREAESIARDYMAQLGFENLFQVIITDSDGDWSSETTIAECSPYGYIRVRGSKLKQLEFDRDRLAEILVHEFFHATWMTSDFIGVRGEAGDEESYEFYMRGGFGIIAGDKDQGAFFEEGAAAFIAATFTRILKGIDRDQPSRDLPEYFVPPDPSMTYGPDGKAFELLGHGLEQQGIMTHDDFYALILETRKSTTRTQALRAFAQAVDSLQPGLYVKLRHLEYSKEAWIKGRDLVYDTISRRRIPELKAANA